MADLEPVFHYTSKVSAELYKPKATNFAFSHLHTNNEWHSIKKQTRAFLKEQLLVLNADKSNVTVIMNKDKNTQSLEQLNDNKL